MPGHVTTFADSDNHAPAAPKCQCVSCTRKRVAKIRRKYVMLGKRLRDLDATEQVMRAEVSTARSLASMGKSLEALGMTPTPDTAADVLRLRRRLADLSAQRRRLLGSVGGRQSGAR